MKTELEFAKEVAKKDGALYDVGGSVRDYFMGIPCKDHDYCVTGFDNESFLLAFPDAKQVIGQNGEKTVDVFLMHVGEEQVEVALARQEVKTGEGYHGFQYVSTKDITIEKDLYRRDLTINSMARKVLTGEIIDPYGGREDIKNRILRATSDAFYEDPLRVYRVAVRYAKTDFAVEERTKEMMKIAAKELHTVKRERVVAEMEKAFSSKKPDLFFRLLQELDILSVHFPEIDALVGVSQPKEHHPEGDVFEHTMQSLREMRSLTDRKEELYAILSHDVGKALTPTESLPKHHGHEAAGVPVVEMMNKRLGVPTTWKKAAMFATENHGKFHLIGEMKSVKVVDLLTGANRNPLGVKGLANVALADRRGRNNPSVTHPYYDFALAAIEEITKVKGNPELEGKRAGEDKRRRQAEVVARMKKEMK